MCVTTYVKKESEVVASQLALGVVEFVIHVM